MNVQDSRILSKRSTVTTQVPTASPSDDHTDGSWDSLDIYKGEFFLNLADDKVFTRFDSGIKLIYGDGAYDTQYLRIDGTNTMSGDLDMGVNSITGVDYIYDPSNVMVLDCANRLFKSVSGLTALDFENRIIQANWTVTAITGTNTLLSGDYRTKTANYTVAVLDELIECTSGTFTVTLYTAVGYFNREVIIANTGAGTITLDGDGSETIQGAATATINAGQTMIVRSDGANWIKISLS